MQNEKHIVESFVRECVSARMAYDQYVAFFERGKQRLDLLEKAAHYYFYDLQGIMQHYIFLRICALTDPSKSCGQDNLTTNYLVEELSWPPDVKTKLEEISSNLDGFRKHLIPARHKIIAHLDKKVHLEGKPLGEFPEGEDKVFWKNLQEFVNIIHKYHFGSISPLEISPNAAEDLIEALKKSVDYDDYFEDKQGEKYTRWEQMRFKDA